MQPSSVVDKPSASEGFQLLCGPCAVGVHLPDAACLIARGQATQHRSHSSRVIGSTGHVCCIDNLLSSAVSQEFL